MKKMILTALAALLIAVPAVQAQKVNQAALVSKIEKSDADIADAKKNAKAATWLNRGKALYEAVSTPTKSLFENMDANMLKLAEGDPTSTEEVTLVEKPYTAMIYPYFTAYVADGKIAAWTQTKEVYPGALDKALEAYAKAYELDPKSADKVKEGLKQISDFCSQVGNVGLTTGEHAIAAAAYRKAFEAQSMPAYGTADAALLYYAGYLGEQAELTEPIREVIGSILGLDTSSLQIVNRPPTRSKPIYMRVWEARKADGLEYDPEDTRQQAFLSEITKYNIKSID